MYSYESYSSNTITPKQLKDLESFIDSALDTSEPAAVNMGRDNSAGLLYNIDHQLRWRSDQGAIFLIYADREPVAVSCVEFPENEQAFSIGGIRTWIKASHRRSQIAGYFLDLHCRWAQERGCAFLLITFNDYNRAGQWGVQRGSKFRQAAGWSPWWDDCVALDQPLTIRSVSQWCVIKPVVSNNMEHNIQLLQAWAAKNK